MSSRHLLMLVLVVGCIAAPMTAAAPADPEGERGFTQTVQPFLNAHCTSCHGGARPAAQLDLRRYTSAASVVDDFSRWNRVLARLAAREMPPKPME